MSGGESGSALAAALPGIPSDSEGPVFPAPWAARAFAMTVALHEAGLFSWSEWAAQLGETIAAMPVAQGDDPEDYWRAWLAALENVLARKQVAEEAHLEELREAWRQAAEATPHGDPVELSRLRPTASPQTEPLPEQ